MTPLQVIKWRIKKDKERLNGMCCVEAEKLLKERIKALESILSEIRLYKNMKNLD